MVELLWKCSIAILNNLLTMYIIKPTVGQQLRGGIAGDGAEQGSLAWRRRVIAALLGG